MDIVTILTLIGEIGALLGAIVPVFMRFKKIEAGIKCQRRSEMLRVYYHNRERETIRQHEYENFVSLYEAYNALKGNSFIDKIYKEVQTWEVVS